MPDGYDEQSLTLGFDIDTSTWIGSGSATLDVSGLSIAVGLSVLAVWEAVGTDYAATFGGTDSRPTVSMSGGSSLGVGRSTYTNPGSGETLWGGVFGWTHDGSTRTVSVSIPNVPEALDFNYATFRIRAYTVGYRTGNVGLYVGDANTYGVDPATDINTPLWIPTPSGMSGTWGFGVISTRDPLHPVMPDRWGAATSNGEVSVDADGLTADWTHAVVFDRPTETFTPTIDETAAGMTTAAGWSVHPSAPVTSAPDPAMFTGSSMPSAVIYTPAIWTTTPYYFVNRLVAVMYASTLTPPTGGGGWTLGLQLGGADGWHVTG